MFKYTPITLALYSLLVFSACNNKPKPTSTDVTRQTVRVNGKKDSVINNTQKNYGNATVSEPCIKCLIQAVQATDNYKQNLTGVDPRDLKYKINWIKADGTVDTTNTKGATNALTLDLIVSNKKISSFIYDNSVSKLFYVKYTPIAEKIILKIDSIQLKKIRNACYWGVASGK